MCPFSTQIVAYSILAEKELLIKSQVLMLTVSRRTYWLARWSFDLIHLFIGAAMLSCLSCCRHC